VILVAKLKRRVLSLSLPCLTASFAHYEQLVLTHIERAHMLAILTSRPSFEMRDFLSLLLLIVAQ
jgi:hypothetical protein